MIDAKEKDGSTWKVMQQPKELEERRGIKLKADK